MKKKGKTKIESQELELNEAYRKCLSWFFSYPTKEMSLSGLALNLGISKTSTKRVVLKLVKEKFLIKEELGKIWRISCNQDHYYNKTLKVTSNLERIYLSNIIKKVNEIVPNSRSIILFGSYRKGDDNENSDIDIAVEVLDNEDLKIVQAGIISKFGYRKNVLVNLHIFSKNKIDLNLFANVSNGIVLQGFLEVHP